ncbi:hypothetical protein XO10_02845 [Marinitoga sp. 1135]|uniref:ABC transporter substrate-binding protein n=1 Tax=unclassified Marinitoga TaxID=2640159 RepID=UPI0009508AC3|nr:MULTISPECIES: ABC transporter substrate-binding protein [unclassified Marinitoga]APT75501.1 hypothetical protein LN42_03160 [Marinitoga sp. 1137]NUU95224.1 hypothetical protein [Marinitoga sp. 1135]
MKKNIKILSITLGAILIIYVIYSIMMPFKVGVIASLNGNEAFMVSDTINGIELFKKLNPDSKKLEIIIEDDGGNVKDAQKAFEKLKRKGVRVILFDSSSTLFEPIYRKLKDEKIIGIGISITADKFKNKNDNFFRLNISNENEQKAIAKYLNKTTDELLVIKDFENPLYINNSFVNFKKYYNGKIYYGVLKNSDISILEQVKNIYEGQNFVYLLINSVTNTAMIANYLKSINKDVYIVITPWIDKNQLSDLLNVKKNVIYSYYLRYKPREDVEFFVKYKELYQREPTIYACGTYEALEVISKIIKNKGREVNAIRDSFFKYRFKTTFGELSFDEYGESNHTIQLGVLE